MPECHLGFYDSLVAFDHDLGATWILSTGLQRNGTRSTARAVRQRDFWLSQLGEEASPLSTVAGPRVVGRTTSSSFLTSNLRQQPEAEGEPVSNLTRETYLSLVERAQRHISCGDIYQVNLSQRLTASFPFSGWRLFRAFSDVSPAPFSTYFDRGDFQIISSSPELFLRMSGSQIRTRPIKGTRPRSAEPALDFQLGYQLQTSSKEMAELLMITDLMRNDLGRVCEFGTIRVPELARLERYPQVQHLVSTVEGTLRPEVTHLDALAACFPGGSITGAPKIRAMQIIDELEPVCRGPYTGAMGYIGFNRESQLSIIIRTALLRHGLAHFQIGAGIVADSDPAAEYLETLAKARGFIEALQHCASPHDSFSRWQVRQ
jgi:para-aminobenzoate synthetase component 1